MTSASTTAQTSRPEFPIDRINELLDQVELVSGHHDDGEKACAGDLIGMAIHGEWTDTPECVHPILHGAIHRINDHKNATTDSRRRLVLEAGPLLVGTAERSTAWAVLVRHAAGLTPGGLVDALTNTPDTKDLAGANLAGADLTGADLTGAYLTGADLTRAYLTRADLTGANLTGANLARAYLTGANLTGANLTRANLARAYLTGAYLTGANLTRANLARAYLTGAYLTRANLTRAYLTGAYLTRADLTGANHDKWTTWPDGYTPPETGAA